MDGILEGPVKTPIFANATKDLREKLSGHWASLATDRVGHHIVKKLFKFLPKIDDKAELVEELVNGGNRLRGNAMGRSVIEWCAVEMYKENKKDWRNKVGKMFSSREESFIAEIIPDHRKQDAATEREEEEATTKTKAKRKRRRKRSATTDTIDTDIDAKAPRKVQKTS